MPTISQFKVVASLPATLAPDAVYYVRVGTGFDIYVTNSSGTVVAYPSNQVNPVEVSQPEAEAGTEAGLRSWSPLRVRQALAGLGYSQTWQNVTGSRATGVTYTNSTGRPIYVSVYLVTGSGGTCFVRVGSVVIGGVNENGVNEKGAIGFVVPNGSTYVVNVATGSMTIDTWAELR